MPKRRNKDLENWYKAPEPEICPLCDREIPPALRDLHHLVPKLKGGKVTQSLHRICHRQIHALFTEAELAQHYSSVDALLTHPDIQTFVQWIKTKPIDFMDRTRRSKRLR